MATPPEIAQIIAKADRAFQPIIDHAGPPPVRRAVPVHLRFSRVIESITSQLLAVAAAHTIHQRVIDRCDGHVTPEAIAGLGVENLRQVGLNRGKATAMVSLAEAVMNGSIVFSNHGRLPDDRIVQELTATKGIGPWTVQMYLMHTLARADVWPVGDYGVRAGWSHLHELRDTIAPKDLQVSGDQFLGVRSAVAWYCWQALHLARTNR